jgi:hypothetical protein
MVQASTHSMRAYNMISDVEKRCFLTTFMAARHLSESDPELQIPDLHMQIKISTAIQLQPSGNFGLWS